jgi:hypothetical protein
MKIAGFLLLLTGWILVLTALGMLHPGNARTAFVCAGLGVEGMGLVLAAQSHRVVSRGEKGRRR